MEKQVQNALVTGASSGIGLATAIELARAGYHVYATVRDKRKADRLMKLAENEDLSHQVEVVELDLLSGSDEIAAVMDDVIGRAGNLDVLVNNAGMTDVGVVELLAEEQWRKVMETNFFGTLFCIRAVLPHFRERGAGHIVNVTSVNGRISGTGNGPYAASKFAVEAMTEALRGEMQPFGVKVALVEPAAFKSDIWSRDYKFILEDGPYLDVYKGIAEWVSVAPEMAGDPVEVAEVIRDIVRDEHPKLRYAVGQVGDKSAAEFIRQHLMKS